MKIHLPFIFIIGTSIFLIFLIYLLYFRHKTATIDGHTFFIETAVTEKEQQVGLAKYSSLAQNNAMYFPFDHPGFFAFWMKDMHFPIDILFLKDKKIVTIFDTVPNPTKDQINLPTYQPSVPANGVLEINAGLSKKYGFHTGDSVEISQ